MKIINLKLTQTKLIELVIHKDRRAQKQLFDQFASTMLGTCRQYIKDLHDAEDVMLIGFMKVFQNINQFADQGSFEGWIRRIMIFESISFLRAKKEIFFAEDVHYTEEVIFENDSFYEVEALQQLIDLLPEGCKVVFVLHIIEGYKHNEIAEMLQISVGTSKSQLAHARKLLQNKLQIFKSKFRNAEI